MSLYVAGAGLGGSPFFFCHTSRLRMGALLGSAPPQRLLSHSARRPKVGGKWETAPGQLHLPSLCSLPSDVLFPVNPEERRRACASQAVKREGQGAATRKHKRRWCQRTHTPPDSTCRKDNSDCLKTTHTTDVTSTVCCSHQNFGVCQRLFFLIVGRVSLRCGAPTHAHTNWRRQRHGKGEVQKERRRVTRIAGDTKRWQ